MNELGVVIIGRNEGERLQRCIRSIVGKAADIVYVDSGSSDDSVAFARSLGVHVVTLDMARPFTAARARNAGFERLLEIRPDLPFVFFADGDCEIVDGFIETALAWLEGHPEFVLVAGRRAERHPEASIYNRLCDLEWNTPVGEAVTCGGESIVRCGIFRRVGMFNPAMIAGEEPELCVRLRKAGGRIQRLDADMSLHDAAMDRFGQWWKRAERAGHAYAEGMARHGGRPWRHNVREVRSILFWAVAVPLVIIAGVIGMLWSPWPGFGAVGAALLLPVLWWRIYRYRRGRGDPASDCRVYATFVVLGKWPECKGILSFWLHRILGRRRALIEYK